MPSDLAQAMEVARSAIVASALASFVLNYGALRADDAEKEADQADEAENIDLCNRSRHGTIQNV